MFSKTAAFYDALYSFKDYKAEAAYVAGIIRERVGDGRLTLLDAACGTGIHISHLREEFECEGLDLDPDLLQIARERNRGVPFHLLDMASFDLGRQFDAVTCLFSAIGYAKTELRLQSAIDCFARHTKPGGVVLVEAWITPDNWKAATLHGLHIDTPDLKLSRISRSPSILPGDYVDLELHYLIGTHSGVEHLVEQHEMGMFTHEQYLEAFELAGLTVERFDDVMARGAYVGKKPLE